MQQQQQEEVNRINYKILLYLMNKIEENEKMNKQWREDPYTFKGFIKLDYSKKVNLFENGYKYKGDLLNGQKSG